MSIRKPDPFASPVARPSTEVGEGQLLSDRYRLVRRLGKGAMGAVYEAVDEQLGQTVCVKLLKAPKMAAHAVEERLRRELLVSRKLAHANVCRVYDHLTHGRQAFLVMELVRGQTLRRAILKAGRLPEEEACFFTRSLLSALGAAHEAGVVHRDVKADNIMVADDGRLVLLDFGIALDRELSRLTAPGHVLGSKRYLAPEMWRGEPPTGASDVWSAGIVFFLMLTGAYPYRTDAVIDATRQGKELFVPRLRDVLPSADAGVDKVLAKMLAGDPAKRFQNGHEALEALVAAMAKMPREPIPVPAAYAATVRQAAEPAPGRIRFTGVEKDDGHSPERTLDLEPSLKMDRDELRSELTGQSAARRVGRRRAAPTSSSVRVVPVGRPTGTRSRPSSVREAYRVPRAAAGRTLKSAAFAIALLGATAAQPDLDPAAEDVGETTVVDAADGEALRVEATRFVVSTEVVDEERTRRLKRPGKARKHRRRHKKQR